MYREHQYLEERLIALRDLSRRAVGEAASPLVCRVCYSLFDYKGCLCDRQEWTSLTVALAELELQLCRVEAGEPAA